MKTQSQVESRIKYLKTLLRENLAMNTNQNKCDNTITIAKIKNEIDALKWVISD